MSSDLELLKSIRHLARYAAFASGDVDGARFRTHAPDLLGLSRPGHLSRSLRHFLLTTPAYTWASAMIILWSSCSVATTLRGAMRTGWYDPAQRTDLSATWPRISVSAYGGLTGPMVQEMYGYTNTSCSPSTT